MNNYKKDCCEKRYDAPAIEVFEINVERGIAESLEVMKNENLIVAE